MAWVNLNTIYATKSEVNSKVPNTRTINGKELSSNVTLGASDIKLSDDTTLQSAWDSISQATGWTYLVGSYPASLTAGYVRYRVNRFSVELDIDYPLADASDKKISKLIPANLCPYETYWFAICATKRWNKSNNMAYCEVKKDGTVWIGRCGAETEGRVIGTVLWIIP